MFLESLISVTAALFVLSAALFDLSAVKFGNFTSIPTFRGPTPSRSSRRRARTSHATLRKEPGLIAGTPGNKLVVKAARRLLTKTIIK
jgi:hypothetical protein